MKFNGSIMTAVGEFSTSGKGTLLYTEQTLTDAEKAQVRANIGAVGSVELNNTLSELVEYLKTIFKEKGTTFKISSFGEFEFDNGMSWVQWLGSGYNTKGFCINEMYGSYIEVGDMYGILVNSYDDAIVEGEVYTPVHMCSEAPYDGDYTSTFTIDGYDTFTFEDGMTWNDWVDSSYNTLGLSYIENPGSYIVVDDGTRGIAVDISWFVKAGAVYQLEEIPYE